MIFIVSSKISGSTSILMEVLAKRNIPAFRFNLDMFDSYRFLWGKNEFEIIDPIGRCCDSSKISAMLFYKGTVAPWFSFEINKPYNAEREWLVSWLNQIYDSLFSYGKMRKLIRLWKPYEIGYAKTLQMEIAEKYFEVPAFKIHWGQKFDSHSVIVKPLTQRPLASGEMAYAKIVDVADLDPLWPWFTQEIADGNQDATVLYIHGKVHCYKFATLRGSTVDWRITQGTNANRWLPWTAGKAFEAKIDTYMKELNLKFGRLDFIIGGNEPQFLEVNPAGQFGWLDDGRRTLHNEVVDAILDPTSTVVF